MIHPRPLLFAPANHARRVSRLGDFGADAVVLDLEDAVAADEKPAARAAVPAAPRRAERSAALRADQRARHRPRRRRPRRRRVHEPRRDHPAQGGRPGPVGQVATAHRGYSQAPPAELAMARRIVAEFADAEARGVASTQVAGVFVDHPVYRRAVELIERHERFEAER